MLLHAKFPLDWCNMSTLGLRSGHLNFDHMFISSTKLKTNMESQTFKISQESRNRYAPKGCSYSQIPSVQDLIYSLKRERKGRLERNYRINLVTFILCFMFQSYHVCMDTSVNNRFQIYTWDRYLKD